MSEGIVFGLTDAFPGVKTGYMRQRPLQLASSHDQHDRLMDDSLANGAFSMTRIVLFEFINVTHFTTVLFPESHRIYRPIRYPNTLFTPRLPSVLSLKFLLNPRWNDNDANKKEQEQEQEEEEEEEEEEEVSLQTAMELDGDTLMFLKIVVSTCRIFMHSTRS